MGYCGLCSPRVVPIADLSSSEVLAREIFSKMRFAGYFFPSVVHCAAGIACCFDGLLAVTELPDNDPVAFSSEVPRRAAGRIPAPRTVEKRSS